MAVQHAVSTRDPRAVRAAVVDAFRAAFADTDPAGVERAFARAEDCFAGREPGYQAIDARYHEFEHTLQGTLCLARLLRGWQRAGATPPLDAHAFELAIFAALLHDTGYLKPAGDSEGTGAKFTLTHVARSAEFAGSLLASLGYPERDIRAVQHMIRCTGINADLASIPFQDERERKLGYALATADLLGQMAAEDYIDKLPLLFDEFAESERFTGRTGATGGFTSAADLIARTPVFWEKYVKPKIERDFGGLHRFLDRPDGVNPYIERVKANIARIPPGV